MSDPASSDGAHPPGPTAAPRATRVLVVDARGLAPPEPFERVIDALATLEADCEVLLVLDREPLPLYRFLDANGYAYTTTHVDPARVEIRIREAAPGG